MRPTTGVFVNQRRQYVSGRTHPRGAGGLAISVVTGFVVLQRLDATLGAMHPPGAASATASGLASPTVLRDLAGHVAGVQAWAAWDRTRTAGELAGTAGWGSRGTLGMYVAVDSLLVALALGWLLLLLNAAVGGPALAPQWAELRRWLRRRRERKDDGTSASRRPIAGSTETESSAGTEPPTTEPVATPSEPGAPWDPRALLVSVPFAAVTYALFDVLENLTLVVTRLWLSQGWLAAAGVLSALKWLALLAAVLPLVVVGIATLARRGAERLMGGPRTASLLEEVFALRAQLVVVAILVAVVALPGELGKQIDDALLVLRGRPLAAVLSLLATVLLCLVIRSSGRLCLRAYERTEARGVLTPRTLRRLGVAGIVMLALGIDSIAGDRWIFGRPPFVALLVPGVLLVLFVLLSLAARRAPAAVWEAREVSRRVLRWFSVAPLLVVGLVAIRAGVLVLVTGEIAKSIPFWLPGILLVTGAGVVAVGRKPVQQNGATAGAGNRPATSSLQATDVLAGLGLVVAMGVGLWGGISPLTAGPRLGTWTLLLVFLMLLLGVLTVLVLAGDRLPVRGVVAAVGLRRVPLMSIFAACVVLTSVVDSEWGYHDTRLITPQPAVASATVTLHDAAETWLKTGDAAPADTDAGTRPLVLIAASGGGIRAAYWTSAVLSCVFSGSPGDDEDVDQPGALMPVPENDPLVEADPCAAEGSTSPDEDDVLIASGISGSSLGLVVRRALGEGAPQYTSALADDFLASNMAAYLFRDAPNSVARLNLNFDWSFMPRKVTLPDEGTFPCRLPPAKYLAKFEGAR